MIANIIILFPLIFALFVRVIPKNIVWSVSLGVSLFQVLVTMAGIYNYYDSPEHPGLFNRWTWISSLGAEWNIGLDGLSLVPVSLLSLLVPLILVVRKNAITETHNLHSLIWWMVGSMYGVFMAKDGLLFYTFWEFSLIPVYFICLKWGDTDRIKTTLRFFIYTIAGSLAMLAALIYVYSKGSGSWSTEALYAAGKSLSMTEQQWVFWGMFLAFAIKIPIVPFHSWQPSTYNSAPLQGTMLLSALMGKMGLWGLLKWLMPLVPAAAFIYQPAMIILCAVSVVYASFMALRQDEVKRLLAWSSMAHMSLMALGIFLWTYQGIQGALLQLFSHGVITLAIFYAAFIITNKTGFTRISQIKGLRSQMPVFSGFFLWIVMASIALPATSGFPGEFALLNATFQYDPVIAGFAGLGTILGAVYMLRAFHHLMHGESDFKLHDIHQNNKALLAVGSLIILVLGIYPGLITDLMESNLNAFISEFTINH